ncbi:MAG: dihydrodipicolinate synthase family protein [Candidatus Abyssubacteria bacterium]
MHTLELDGLVPAAVTPMTDAFEIDEAALRDYIRWLLSFDGLKAAAVNMDTGEGPHLTAEERKKIISVWKEETGPRLLVLAGVGGPSTAEAVRQAREAEQAGADALVIFPIPAYLGKPLAPEIPLKHHQAIAAATGLPLVLFQLQPDLGGVIFDEETLGRLLEIESVVAIKEASFDTVIFARTEEAVRRTSRKISVLTGNDNFILESFLLGADGALIGFGTVAVAEQIQMIRLAKDGRYPEALDIYRSKIRPLVNAVFAPPVRDYRARLKEALALMGVVPKAIMRPPLLPLGGADKLKLGRTLRELGIIE